MTDFGDRHAPVSVIAMGEIRNYGERRHLDNKIHPAVPRDSSRPKCINSGQR